MNQILLILVFIAGLNPCISLNTRADLFNPFLIFSGETQSLITFSHPIPEKIKLLEKVNFSFYVDQSVISQYRYMIQVPKGSNSGIEERLTQWSPWKFDGIAEILTQSFQNEGNFKFCVEFRQHSSGESKVFEKPLTVRWENPEITGNKFPVDNQYINSGKKEEVFKRAAEEYKKSYDIWFRNFKQSYNGMGLSKQPPEVLIDKLSEQIIKSSREGIINSAGKDISPKSILLPSYVLELIKKGNSDLIMVFRNPQANTAASMASASKAIQSVYTAEYETKSRTFAADTAELAQVEHALKPAGENDLLKGETDPTLKPFVNLQSESNKIQIIEDTSKKKVDYLPQADYDKMPLDSLNEKDNFGNAPLHLAILRGDSEYSELLISKGADINLKNQTDLTPLHLAVFLNQKETVNNLIVKGAEINLQGYYGYNALHIATELGYTEVAGILLRAGAAANIRTAQKLSPNIIARIQDNPEMISLIKSRGKSAQNSFSKNYISLTVKDVSAYPEIDFQLPYDPELVRKRNVNRLIQWISVPVFVASAAGAVYLRSEANTFFKNYKVAENADDALNYYNKTKRYDTYALISVTISAGSVYSFIHSAIRKNSITKKMRKSF